MAVDPFPTACLRCCSANWSRADWEGSFKERKLSTEPAFFFFFGDLESFDVAGLESVEARLGGGRLAVSTEGRDVVEGGLESGVVERSWTDAEVDPVSWDCCEKSEAWSDGKGFRYLNFGMRAGGGCAVKSTMGAMASETTGVDLGRAVSCRFSEANRLCDRRVSA